MSYSKWKIPIFFSLATLFFSLCAIVGAERYDAFAKSDGGRFEVVFSSPVGEFRYTDEEIEPTDYLVADEIFRRKINAPLPVKRTLMSRAVGQGASYERAVTLCMPKMKAFMDEVERKVYLPSVDAQMKFRPNVRPPFKIAREKKGRELLREKAFELVYIAAHREGTAVLKLPLAETEPEVKAEMLAENTYLKADFFTNYSQGNADREHNIALALSKISGSKIEPNEEFSFNAAVGARTKENGFKQAKIIMDGDYVLGYGGGVCQASTTLYNAALRAGMEITAVRNHSLSAGYVAPSLDAMVNSSTSDLKFRNPLSAPVYIAASASGGVARVRIYGARNEYTILPRSVVVSRQAPPSEETVIDVEHKYLPEQAPSGERLEIRQGKEGIKSEAYLEYYKNGRFIRRVKIRTDTYNPLRGMIAVAP